MTPDLTKRGRHALARPRTDARAEPFAIHAEGLSFRYRPAVRMQSKGPWRRGAAPGRTPPEASWRLGASPRRADHGDREGTWVLDDLSFTCRPGEIVGLLGPNGAGKSTLLRILATLLPPASGVVKLLDRDAYPPAPPLRRRIGYAADETTHFDALSGRENLLFFARAAGLGAAVAAAAADRLLERFGLEDAAARPASEFSLGMRRKLLLAEVLAHSPDLVYVDEPTIGLDPGARDSLRELLHERAAGGAAIVLATHDTAEALRLCSRVVFLHRGRTVLDGCPRELIARLGGPARIEIALAEPVDGFEAPSIRGVRVESVTGERLLASANTGSATLPALCDALIRAGAEIRSLRVREPDLADVFRAVAGIEMDRGDAS